MVEAGVLGVLEGIRGSSSEFGFGMSARGSIKWPMGLEFEHLWLST